MDNLEIDKSLEFNRLLDVVNEACQNLPLYQMKKLKSVVGVSYRQRFKQKAESIKRRIAKKPFTDLEFQHFLRNVNSEKFRLLFKYQALLGIQIREVCKLHISEINPNGELLIVNDKGKASKFSIPERLLAETKEFIADNLDKIIESQGFIFFKENGSASKELHVSKDYVRNVFRSSIKRANMESVYDYSNETLPTRKARALHTLTTRSLCKYARAIKIYKTTA